MRAARLPVAMAGALVATALIATGAAAQGVSRARNVQVIHLRAVSEPSRFALANRCWTMTSLGNLGLVSASREGYHTTLSKAEAARLYLKPTRLGSYVLYDQDRVLVTANGRHEVSRTRDLGKPQQWAVRRAPGSSLQLVSTAKHRKLAVSGH
jgi:hypothetical protein